MHGTVFFNERFYMVYRFTYVLIFFYKHAFSQNEEVIIMGKTINKDNLTQKLRTQFSNELNGISILYSREDAEAARNAVLKAEPDSRRFRERELKTICDAYGVDMKELIRKRSLLGVFPSRDDIYSRINQIIYEMYQTVPSPENSMERIVRRLAPEYADDSVRLAILKKFMNGAGFACKTIDISEAEKWAVKHMDAQTAAQYRKNRNDDEKLEMIIAALDDSIFENVGQNAEITPRDTVTLMADKTESIRENQETIDASGNPYVVEDIVLSTETLERLVKYCEEKGYGSQDGKTVIAVLRTILENDPSDLSAIEPLVKDLESEYKNWLNTFWYKDRKGNLKKVFELYKEARKDVKSRNKKQKEIALAKLADDFASGVFRTDNGLIRERLYWFAIMFGMSAAIGNMENRNPDTDIEKNLFEDYYCDNLMRWFSERYREQKNASVFENEPTGESINPKNYIEAIYLYYLKKDDPGLTPGMRIDKAREMIASCETYMDRIQEYETALENGASATIKKYEKPEYAEYKFLVDNHLVYSAKTPEDMDELSENIPNMTVVYRESLLPELMDLEEDAVPQYMVMNYAIRAHENKTSPRIRISSSEHTAYSALSDTLENTVDLSDSESERPLILNMLKLADSLAAAHPDDTDFVRLCERMKERISFDYTMSGNRSMPLMAAVLRTLYLSKKNEKKSVIEIRKEITTIINRDKYGFDRIPAANIRRVIENLKAIGFDIAMAAEEEKPGEEPERVYWLAAKKYDDQLLNAVLKEFDEPEYFNRETIERVTAMLSDLVLMRGGEGSRPTRNMMVIAKAMDYIYNEYEDDNVSLPEIYENFASFANEQLTEARYQKISEKNIFDVFVICSIYANILADYRE